MTNIDQVAALYLRLLADRPSPERGAMTVISLMAIASAVWVAANALIGIVQGIVRGVRDGLAARRAKDGASCR